MFILFICILAAATAAPQFPFQSRGYPARSSGIRNPYFRGDTFDTGSFWSSLETEMKQLDDMLDDFYKRFPSSVSQEGVQGNDYIITIPLSGYEEKDIVVKAREGLLMVQAVRNMPAGHQNNYLAVRTLPACVNVNGTWTYSQNVLKIVFPIKGSAVTESVPTSTTETTDDHTSAPVTESREEVDMNNDNNQDIDMGGNRGDVHNTELRTNEIPQNNVEATTYAVDLKDQYEFVPVNF